MISAGTYLYRIKGDTRYFLSIDAAVLPKNRISTLLTYQIINDIDDYVYLIDLMFVASNDIKINSNEIILYYPRIKIACLNVGYHVMDNIVAGSESAFVKTCQLTYPQRHGWLNASISQCTANAAEFLSHYDIFGLQEVNEAYKDGFFNSILEFNQNFVFLSSYYHGNISIVIGYDSEVMGHGIQITHNMLLSSKTDKRAIQAVWFKKLHLLFINVHAPHNINLKTKIEQACQKMISPYEPERVIIVGDFNDGKGQLFNTSIEAFDKEIRLPTRYVIPKTCCADNNYKFGGDYILDSRQPDDNTYFGLPPGYNRNIDLLSDHDPVVLIEY